MEYKIVEKPAFTFAGVSKRVPVIKKITAYCINAVC